MTQTTIIIVIIDAYAVQALLSLACFLGALVAGAAFIWPGRRR
jgi:hypothetical protein